MAYSTARTVLDARRTPRRVLTFDGWPYAGKEVLVLSTSLGDDDDRVPVGRTMDDAVRGLVDRPFGVVDADVVLALVASNATDGGMVHATYWAHRE